MQKSPTERFSSRVENYVKSRPSYPPAVLGALWKDSGLTPESVIADIGSGTGLLAELFLQNGNTVYGVEPNRAMREAGEIYLQSYPRFHSVVGTAEGTTLPDDSVDFITAGQAFHWFDRDAAKREFQRILRPNGWVALAWNERKLDDTPFLQDYERLLETFANDYKEVNHTQITAQVIAHFYAPHPVVLHTFAHSQQFDFDGLKARVLSSSYAPEAGHPQYDAMLAELAALFDRNAQDGQISFDYDTNLYCGQLNG